MLLYNAFWFVWPTWGPCCLCYYWFLLPLIVAGTDLAWRLVRRIVPPTRPAKRSLPDRLMYRVIASRAGGVTDPHVLVEPLVRLVDRLRRVDRRLFALEFFSATGRWLTVNAKRACGLLEGSATDWHGDRPPTYATHSFDLHGDDSWLLVRFFVGPNPDRAGLTVYLRLEPTAVDRWGAKRESRLGQVLAAVVESLGTERRAILRPGEGTPNGWESV